MNAERLLQLYGRVSEAPDAIPRLRKFILDLAVRGKLVEQDAGDEPAADLLRKIEDEKVRLVKAGEIRKPKDLPPVTEPPYQLPENWVWTRIRKVTSDRGQKIPTGRFTYIDVTSINKEVGVVSEPKVLEAAEAPSRARKIVATGDVIYSCVRPYLLNVAVIRDHLDPAPIASTAFAVLNGHGLVSAHYIWIVLRAPFMVELVEGNQRGQAYPAINDSDFAVLPFPLPPLAEQHRIVAKVDELMALLDRLEAKRAKREEIRDKLTTASLSRLTSPETDLVEFKARADFAINVLPELTTRPDQIKALRQTILDLAVRGKLVEQDPNDEPADELIAKIRLERARLNKSGEKRKGSATPSRSDSAVVSALPQGWAATQLGAVIQLTSGQHLKPSEYSEDAHAGTPYITGPADFAANGLRITRFATVRKAIAKRGQLLLTVKGSGVGKATICSLKEVAISRQLMSLTAILWDSRYMDFVVNRLAKSMQRQARSLIPGISRQDIEQYRIAMPPLPEQRRIVAKIDELMTLCDQLERDLNSGLTNRSGLMEALLVEALEPMNMEAHA